MADEPCPKCDATTVVDGEMNGGGGGSDCSKFTPAGLRFFSLHMWWTAPPCGVCRACLRCGFVWTQLRPEDLRAYIDKHGNAETKLNLSPFQKGLPDRDVV